MRDIKVDASRKSYKWEKQTKAGLERGLDLFCSYCDEGICEACDDYYRVVGRDGWGRASCCMKCIKRAGKEW